jgi:hypothetical protein
MKLQDRIKCIEFLLENQKTLIFLGLKQELALLKQLKTCIQKEIPICNSLSSELLSRSLEVTFLKELETNKEQEIDIGERLYARASGGKIIISWEQYSAHYPYLQDCIEDLNELLAYYRHPQEDAGYSSNITFVIKDSHDDYPANDYTRQEKPNISKENLNFQEDAGYPTHSVYTINSWDPFVEATYRYTRHDDTRRRGSTNRGDYYQLPKTAALATPAIEQQPKIFEENLDFDSQHFNGQFNSYTANDLYTGQTFRNDFSSDLQGYDERQPSYRRSRNNPSARHTTDSYSPYFYRASEQTLERPDWGYTMDNQPNIPPAIEESLDYASCANSKVDEWLDNIEDDEWLDNIEDPEDSVVNEPTSMLNAFTEYCEQGWKSIWTNTANEVLSETHSFDGTPRRYGPPYGPTY